MDRKDDQEHWRPARRSFIGLKTRVQERSWRIPAHFLQTFGNVQYHLSVYRRCSVSVQTAQFLWYFKPVLHPSVDYCGLSVLFELLHVVRSRMTERIVMATESCTHKRTRENMTVYLQLWIFLVFFLLLPCCGGTNCESRRRAKAGDDEQGKNNNKSLTSFQLLSYIL